MYLNSSVVVAVVQNGERQVLDLPSNPTKPPINDCLMTLQLSLGNVKCATLIRTYAPTMTDSDDVKDMFYEELDSPVATVPQSEKLIVLGDFVIGRHGIDKCKINGLLLLKMCVVHELSITNTIFRSITSWYSSWYVN